MVAGCLSSQRLYARLLGDLRHGECVTVRGVPTGAKLQSHRHIDSRNDRLEDLPDQTFILQQCGPRHDITDFFGRATHIDVDDLGAAFNIETRRFGHHSGVCTGNLHGTGFYLTVVIHTPQGLPATPQRRVTGHHLGYSEPGAQ